MLRGLSKIVVVAALAASLLPLSLPEAASAHEGRPVGGGHQFVVGFLNEPAYVGEMNGLSLAVTEDGQPVEGLEKTLKATVVSGGGANTMPLELRPRFGQPGHYAGYFVPTREGSYIFQISGTIDDEPLNERFESGPGRFNDVQGVQALQFPEKLPDGLAMANEIRAAREEAASARLLGMGGLAAGIAGLAAAGLALWRRRERQPSLAASESKAA